ncbi:hypothetical protein M422DRAFT_245173 [Sphaerobolus stellatus SS14]|nr:hypothetical protein M422DRAFT_245173 [Sphaerobolus stellatus SS14]
MIHGRLKLNHECLHAGGSRLHCSKPYVCLVRSRQEGAVIDNAFKNVHIGETEWIVTTLWNLQQEYVIEGQLQPVVADEQPQPVVDDGQPHPVVAEGQLQENLPVEDPFSQEIPEEMGVQAENSQTLEVNPIEVTVLD